MDGSNGKIVELLERIAAGQDALAAGQEATRSEMQHMRSEMQQGFGQVSSRLDQMVRFLGGYHADHEQRIKALEERVFKQSG